MTSATFTGDDFAGRPPLRAVPHNTKTKMARLLAAREAAHRMANRVAAATRGSVYWLRTVADAIHLGNAVSRVWRSGRWLLVQTTNLIEDVGGKLAVCALLASSKMGSRLLRRMFGRAALSYRWLATRCWMGIDGLLCKTGKTGTTLADKLALTRLTVRTTLRSWTDRAKELLRRLLPGGTWTRRMAHAAIAYHATCSLIRSRVPAGWKPFVYLLALVQLIVAAAGRSRPRLRSVRWHPFNRNRPASPSTEPPATAPTPEQGTQPAAPTTAEEVVEHLPKPARPEWLPDPDESLALGDPTLLPPPGNREARREAARASRNRNRRR